MQYRVAAMVCLSRIRLVVIKKFDLEVLINIHVLNVPESEKKNSFRIMSVCVSVNVCEHNNSKTKKARGIKFGI